MKQKECIANPAQRTAKFILTFILCVIAMSANSQALTDKSIEDVCIEGDKREYIRLKGYYRSYQTNDSVLMYYRDGMVEYYVKCKDGDIDVDASAERFLRNEKAYRKGAKKTFNLSDNMTARPLPEKKTLLEKSNGRYTLTGDSTAQDIMLGTHVVGRLCKDKAGDLTTMTIDLLAPEQTKTTTLFGKTCTLEQFKQTETYKYDNEYESLMNLRQLKSIRSYRFDYNKKNTSQLITAVSELYIFETEYVSKAEKRNRQRATHNETNTASAAKTINGMSDCGITPIDISTLWYYDPANLNKSMAQ